MANRSIRTASPSGTGCFSFDNDDTLTYDTSDETADLTSSCEEDGTQIFHRVCSRVIRGCEDGFTEAVGVLPGTECPVVSNGTGSFDLGPVDTIAEAICAAMSPEAARKLPIINDGDDESSADSDGSTVPMKSCVCFGSSALDGEPRGISTFNASEALLADTKNRNKNLEEGRDENETNGSYPGSTIDFASTFETFDTMGSIGTSMFGTQQAQTTSVVKNADLTDLEIAAERSASPNQESVLSDGVEKDPSDLPAAVADLPIQYSSTEEKSDCTEQTRKTIATDENTDSKAGEVEREEIENEKEPKVVEDSDNKGSDKSIPSMVTTGDDSKLDKGGKESKLGKDPPVMSETPIDDSEELLLSQHTPERVIMARDLSIETEQTKNTMEMISRVEDTEPDHEGEEGEEVELGKEPTAVEDSSDDESDVAILSPGIFESEADAPPEIIGGSSIDAEREGDTILAELDQTMKPTLLPGEVMPPPGGFEAETESSVATDHTELTKNTTKRESRTAADPDGKDDEVELNKELGLACTSEGVSTEVCDSDVNNEVLRDTKSVTSGAIANDQNASLGKEADDRECNEEASDMPSDNLDPTILVPNRAPDDQGEDNEEDEEETKDNEEKDTTSKEECLDLDKSVAEYDSEDDQGEEMDLDFCMEVMNQIEVEEMEAKRLIEVEEMEAKRLIEIEEMEAKRLLEVEEMEAKRPSRVAELLDIVYGADLCKAKREARASRVLEQYRGKEDILLVVLEEKVTKKNHAAKANTENGNKEAEEKQEAMEKTSQKGGKGKGIIRSFTKKAPKGLSIMKKKKKKKGTRGKEENIASPPEETIAKADDNSVLDSTFETVPEDHSECETGGEAKHDALAAENGNSFHAPLDPLDDFDTTDTPAEGSLEMAVGTARSKSSVWILQANHP